MNNTSAEDITGLLRSARAGDKEAEARLVATVYGELRAIASRYLNRERTSHTLETTALVNEAYLRLMGPRNAPYKDRAHFFGVAAHTMRHILVDYARSRLAGKRGAGVPPLPIDAAITFSDDRLEHLLVLEDALQRLESHDPRSSRVFVLRYFGGLNNEEIGTLLEISSRTVKRDWTYACAWLRAELTREHR